MRVSRGKLLSPARRHDAVNHLIGQGFLSVLHAALPGCRGQRIAGLARRAG